MIKNAPESSGQLFRMKRGSLIQLAILVIALVVIVPQFSQFSSSWQMIRSAHISWILIALLGMIGTVLSATAVYTALIPHKLKFKQTFTIQLATYFTNRLLPSGLGGIGFNALYLVKKAKMSRTDAAVYATANNIVGFVAFSMCIWASTFIADSKIESNIPLKKILLIILAIAFTVSIISLFIKPVQKRIIDFLGHLLGVVIAIMKHPKRLLLAVMASIGITISYALVLWASTKSVGISLSIVDIFIAFVAGNAVLTVSPTPGGIGAVEAAITAVIASSGVEPGLALAAVVVYRLVSYWIPVLPGYIAFRVASKHNLV